MAVWSSVPRSALSADFRVDPEYYRPECLAQAKAIEALPHRPLSEVATVSDGNHVTIADQFCEDGVRYLRGQDLTDCFISEGDPVYIPEATYQALRRSHMRPGDVLLSIVGTIGAVGLVTDRFTKLTGSCKIAIVRPREVIQSEYLAAFFLSQVGQREIHRRVRGTVQTGVILPDLRDIPIPILPPSIRSNTVARMASAYACRKKADILCKEAEYLLASALGLQELDLAPHVSFERSYVDVKLAARLDAEYFNPRVQTLITALSRDGLTISDVAKLAKRPFKALPDGEFQYIEISDVSSSRGVADCQPVASEEAPSRAKWVVKSGDVITSTVRPIRRLSAMITDDQDGSVCSSGFAVLSPQGIAPELLLVYLRLPLVCELLDIHTTASMYPAIATEVLMKLPVALPDRATAQQIVIKVQESVSAWHEARRLVRTAAAMIEQEMLKASVV